MNESKPMPQAIEIERAVLGAMLLDNMAIPRVMKILENETAFYNTAHRKIFKTIITLYRQSIPADQVTISEELAKDEKNKIEPFYIAELASEMATATNAEHHALILLEKSQRRRLIAQGQLAITEALDETGSIEQKIENNLKRLHWISQRKDAPGNPLEEATRMTLLEESLDDPETLFDIIKELESLEYEKLPAHYSQKYKNLSSQIIASNNGQTLISLDNLRDLIKEKKTFDATHNPTPLTQYLQQNSHTKTIVQGMIYEGEIHAFAGAPEGGKSFFASYLALSLAAGIPVWDMKTARSRVLYVNFDTPEKRHISRLNAITAGHKFTSTDLQNSTLYHYNEESLDLSDPTSRLHLSQFIKINEIDVLIIDTLTKVIGTIDELKPTDMNTVEQFLRELKIAVIYIHHTNKTKGYQGQDLLRGSSAGILDSGYRFEKTDRDKNRFKISQIKQRNAPFPDLEYALKISSEPSGHLISARFQADHFMPETQETT